MRKAFVGFTALVLLAIPAQAQDKSLGVQGKGFYAFATSESQANGAVFGLMKNTKPVDVTITTVTGDVAESYELHTMSMKDDVMEMRQVEGITVPLRNTHLLQPNGDHIMLMGLKKPLKEGDTLYLRIEDADGRGVQLPVAVRAPGDVPEEMIKQAEIEKQKAIGTAARLKREADRKKAEEERAAAAAAAKEAAENGTDDAAEEVKGTAEDMAAEADDATDEAEEAVEAVKEAPAEIIKDARETMEDSTEAVEEHIEEIKESAAPINEEAPAAEPKESKKKSFWNKLKW